MLAFHERLTECTGAGVPVPVKVSVEAEGCALLVKVRVALAAPVVCGLKVTLKEVLCPAGIVTGNGRPPTLNAELLALAAPTVTFAPLAVSVPDAVPLVPTTTLPVARVDGVTDNCPGVAEPVPDTATVNVGFVALEVIVTLPFTAPADCGAKETLKPRLWPAVNVTPEEIPFKLNPVPVIPAWEIVTVVPPVLVTVSARVWVPPTATVPNARLVGFDPSAPDETPVPDTGIVKVGFVAFEVTVILPLTAPAEAGANVTLKVAL